MRLLESLAKMMISLTIENTYMIHGDGSLKHFGVCKLIFKTRSEVFQKTQRDFGTDRRNRDHLDDLDDDLDAGGRTITHHYKALRHFADKSAE